MAQQDGAAHKATILFNACKDERMRCDKGFKQVNCRPTGSCVRAATSSLDPARVLCGVYATRFRLLPVPG
jgi:hypothetical protein